MSAVQSENPLIVQSDRTVLLDVHSPLADEARERLAQFAELIKSPEHVHTYRLTPLSVWNACAAGLSGWEMVVALREFAKYPPPEIIFSDIEDLASRYGCVILEREGSYLKLTVGNPAAACLSSVNTSISSKPLPAGSTTLLSRERHRLSSVRRSTSGFAEARFAT